jgi:hypothetical protein
MQILSKIHTSVAQFGERLPRLIGWAFVTLLLSFAVWWMAPQQLPVTAYKLSLVTLAGVIGYWLDRSLFPYARPDSFQELEDAILVDPDDIAHVGSADVMIPVSGTQDLLFAAAMLRRAIIVGCAMLAMGLGA